MQIATVCFQRYIIISVGRLLICIVLRIVKTDRTCSMVLHIASVCVYTQVSWQWKTLVDSDELWTVMCQRLGWTLNHSVSPFDKSAWKRLYIDNIVALKRTVTPVVRYVFMCQQWTIIVVILANRLCTWVIQSICLCVRISNNNNNK